MRPKQIIILQFILMTFSMLSPLLQPGHFYVELNFSEVWRIAVCTGAIFSLFLVVLAMLSMKKAFTVKAIAKPNGFLVLQGPFRFIRNPMYTGGFLMSFSWAIWHQSLLSLFTTFCLGIFLSWKVRIEEKSLVEKYGKDYIAYCDRVGRFIPGVGKSLP